MASAPPTTPKRPAWLILTAIALAVAVLVIGANALLGDTGNDVNTDPLVDALCTDDPDC